MSRLPASIAGRVPHRRVHAAEKLGWKEISAFVSDQVLTKAETIQRQMICNCQHSELQPLDRARALADLMEATGWNVTQTAAAVGFSNASVTRSLAMLTLPVDIQEKVRSGALSASTAYSLACVKDPVERDALSREVAAGSLTRDETVARVRKRQSTSTDSSQPLLRITAKLDAKRSLTVAAPGLNLEGLIKILEDLLTRARHAHGKHFTLSTFRKVLGPLIPATIGRPGINGPKGYYRRLMRKRFKRSADKHYYGQRWQAETVNSMIKRNLGSACRARTAKGRCKDMMLRAITHNVMILANL